MPRLYLLTLFALCTLSGCGLARQIQERQFQAQQNTCQSYGAGPGTPGYTDCMLRLHGEQVAAQQAWAQQNEQREEANARVFTRPIYVPQPSITCQRIGTFTYCN